MRILSFWIKADCDDRTGVICIFLCFAVGVSNLFHLTVMIVFGALCM